MIVISAASGNLGRATAKALQTKVNPKTVRLAARSTDKLADFAGQGFDVVKADYENAASLRAAFAGADSVLIISSDGPNEVRAAHHKAAIDAAKAAGVKKIVYTSAINPVSSSRFVWAGAHETTEATLKASGVPYVILRDNSYASNNDGFYAQAKETGTLALPGAATKVSYVTHEDVAASAAAALTGAGAINTIYELTGSEAFDAHDIANVLSQVTGRTIKAVDLSLADLGGFFTSIGLPPFVVEGLVSFYAAAAAGEYAAVSGDVQKLTGRPAQSLRDYLRKFA